MSKHDLELPSPETVEVTDQQVTNSCALDNIPVVVNTNSDVTDTISNSEHDTANPEETIPCVKILPLNNKSSTIRNKRRPSENREQPTEPCLSPSNEIR